MNTSLIVAVVLILALGAGHSYLGERFILTRLFRRSDLPHMFGSDAFTRQTLRFAWHLTTVVWFGVAALLYVMAVGVTAITAAQIGGVIAVTSLVSAVVAGIGSRGRHPSWIVFLIIAALVWYGTR